MKIIGTILLIFGWLLGVILVCIPLVHAIQSGSFAKSTWIVWVTGIILFIVLTEFGKHLRGKEADNAGK